LRKHIDKEKWRLTDINPATLSKQCDEKIHCLYHTFPESQKEKVADLIIEDFCVGKLKQRLSAKWQNFFGPTSKYTMMIMHDDLKTKYHRNPMRGSVNKWMDL
jgi:hypothetical protein